VLVVLVVLLGALYATLFVYTQGFGVLEANGQRLQAIQRLQAELERLRVTPYDALPPEAHRLPSADATRLAVVTLGHPPLPTSDLTVRWADGSPGPAPAAVDAATDRLALPTAPEPQTVLITYTYSPPPPPEKGGKGKEGREGEREEFTVSVTGTSLDEDLQPVSYLTLRKRLTVTVAWTARGKEHRIQGHLLRTP
jgi:hypothetical protein